MRINYTFNKFYATSTSSGGGGPTADDINNLKDLGLLLGKTDATIKAAVADASKFYDILRQWNKELLDAEGGFNGLSDTLKGITREFGKAGDLTRDVNKSFNNISSIGDKLKRDQREIEVLDLKQLKNLEKKFNIEKDVLADLQKELQSKFDNNIASDAEIDRLIEINGLLDTQGNLNKDIANYFKNFQTLLNERIQTEKDINKNLGITGALAKIVQNTLSKWGVDTSFFDNLNKKLREAAKPDSLKKPWKVFTEELQEGLTEALQDPVAKFFIGFKAVKSGLSDIKKAFNVFLEFDKVFTETARGLGMSTDQVIKMTKATQLSGDAFSKNVYTAAQIGKSISDVNAQLGTSVIVSGQTLDEFTAMTNQMGLSADEASKIYKLSLLNGSSLKDTNKDIAAGILAVQKRSGIQINEKQVFQEIGKLSAGITAKFQQNVPALAAAVAQAKALGTNLEQVDKIGESLLNFESSIESELKAELITGKQLNLEKARYAALTGDQVTLTQELANQVGSLSEFQGMNVIAQKSLAEAFGMSREELAEMLKQQAVFNKLGDVSNMTAQQKLDRAKELKLSNDDALVQDLQRQASAEQLAATFDSIKVSIAEALNGPFKGLVNVFANLAKNAGAIKFAIGALAAISLTKTIGGLAVMAVQLGIGAAAAITTAAAITLGLGVIGIIAALNALSGAQEDVEASIKARVPGAAFGGIVEAKPGGTLVNVAEAGSDELLIPLNSPKANAMMGGGGGVTVDDLREFATNIVSGIRNQTQPDIIFSVDGDSFGRIAGKQASTSTNTRQYNSYNLA